MKIRRKGDRTIDAYAYHINRFDKFLGEKNLLDVTPEDIRDFQLYLIETKKLAYSSCNQAVCALRFFYQVSYPREWPVVMIPYGKRPKKLPVVLGRSEVAELLKCTINLKHRTFLSTLYAGGLRLAEAANLKLADIDSSRMQIHIVAGKGAKDRNVPLSPRLLAMLREYWAKYRPPGYLFPGKTPDRPYVATSIQKAIKVSAQLAGIRKLVTPHTLRHSYATGLLEAGVDILTISRLLGHASFTTTMIYLHVRSPHLDRTPSPLDWLPTRQLPKWEDPTVNDNAPNHDAKDSDPADSDPADSDPSQS